MKHIRVIGLDADDTLWHNEIIFERVHERYRALLAQYHDRATVDCTLFATEMRNLELYGYGVKGFTLSAIETAIELTQGKISAEEIRTLIDLGQEMLNHPVELLEGITETISVLSESHTMLVITKGDLRDQQRKLVKSGLAGYFRGVEIVSEKDAATYTAILQRQKITPVEFMMAGNSLKSDILPVLSVGSAAVYVPYHITWMHERSSTLPDAPGRFFQLEKLQELPALLAGASQ